MAACFYPLIWGLTPSHQVSTQDESDWHQRIVAEPGPRSPGATGAGPTSWSCFGQIWSLFCFVLVFFFLLAGGKIGCCLMQLPPHFTPFSTVWRFIYSIYLLLLWLCSFVRLDFSPPSTSTLHPPPPPPLAVSVCVGAQVLEEFRRLFSQPHF